MTMMVWVADRSQVTRLGIISILKNLDHQLSIREISSPGKLEMSSPRYATSMLIISASFLSSCKHSTEDLLGMIMIFPARILILDGEIPALLLTAFGEVIHCDDSEKAILRKVNGQVDLLAQISGPNPKNNEISEREKEVLRFVAMGLTNKEIAEKLYISAHTVIAHRKNITAKLGIKTIAGLSVYAVINKLVSIEDIH